MYYYLEYNKSLKQNISMMFKYVLFDDFDSMLLSSLNLAGIKKKTDSVSQT